MTIRHIFFLVCLVCVAFLLTGALNPQDFSQLSVGLITSSAAADFVAGPIDLPQGWENPTLAPTAFLDSIAQTFRPANFAWLDMRLWQCCREEEGSFHAEGSLLWAKEHKVRLEWKIQGRQPSTLLVVSDGRRLQRTFQVAGQSPEHQVYPLPAAVAGQLELEQRRWKILESHGCTGFMSLLAELRVLGRDWQKETGQWRGRSVVRLSADLAPSNADVPRARANRCRVFLSAQNLWPLRLEWLKSDRIVVEMEFRDPKLDNAPVEPELGRLFNVGEKPR